VVEYRDRGGDGSEPIRFSSAVLPPYLRRARNVEELLPWLYLKGVSTGRFAEALAALLGPDAPGLSAATVRRLTEAWQEEHARWQRRDLSARRYEIDHSPPIIDTNISNTYGSITKSCIAAYPSLFSQLVVRCRQKILSGWVA
jgi:hypothetical protein